MGTNLSDRCATREALYPLGCNSSPLPLLNLLLCFLFPPPPAVCHTQKLPVLLVACVLCVGHPWLKTWSLVISDHRLTAVWQRILHWQSKSDLLYDSLLQSLQKFQVTIPFLSENMNDTSLKSVCVTSLIKIYPHRGWQPTAAISYAVSSSREVCVG